VEVGDSVTQNNERITRRTTTFAFWKSNNETKDGSMKSAHSTPLAAARDKRVIAIGGKRDCVVRRNVRRKFKKRHGEETRKPQTINSLTQNE